ncbi:MAG: trypsin-like peptidase domain-containing protein [Peptoniphilus sp.]|nr:trypsin-like peptidase domain-containing protein [Peptoniphilus sp.]MDD7363172.1 trypsin-like peptidase domain-containing protein [Bacillota bacterium]MDY6044504.1 trypsin-like peptidase domain-containing protein [Peptoniphilus sp.]
MALIHDNQDRDPERTYTYTTQKKRRRPGRFILLALIFSLIGGVVGSAVTYKRMASTPPQVVAESARTGDASKTSKVQRNHKAGVVESVAQASMPSVVGITTASTRQTPLGPMAVQGSGSGFIVSEDGYILSNAHVVGEAKNSVKVLLNDGSEADGTVVWSDAALDLGLVKIKKDGLVALPMGDSDDLNIGEVAVAIGNPLGLDFQRSVTAGVISGLNRNIGEVEGNYMDGLIQTDASINAGNSGGPLLNEEGQVIGINSVKIASAEGLGFSIPINTAKPIVEQVIKTGDYKTVALGISGYTVSAIERSGYDLGTGGKGVIVGGVESESPAAKAGLQVNDIILKLGDKEINSMSQMRRELYKYHSGDTVEVVVARGSKKQTLKLTFTDYQVPKVLPQIQEQPKERKSLFPIG